MTSPKIVKEYKDLEISVNDTDERRLKWLSGYFDAKGSCSFKTDMTPIIQILNANPKVATLIYAVFKKHGIVSKTSERSKTGKSSKKKRWDVFTETKSETIKVVNLLLPFIQGKKEQLITLIEKYDSKKLKYLNATNNVLIKDNDQLFNSLGFKKDQHETISDDNTKLEFNSFCDVDWLCGFIDSVGNIKLDKRDMKGRDMAHFTPILQISHHNKKCMNAAYSTLRNLKVGCHVHFGISEKLNRGKWTLTVSGLKRIKFLCFHILDHLVLKKDQINILNLYIYRRLQENPESIDEMGYSTHFALNDMEKTL